jgi:hypothetical protein
MHVQVGFHSFGAPVRAAPYRSTAERFEQHDLQHRRARP